MKKACMHCKREMDEKRNPIGEKLSKEEYANSTTSVCKECESKSIWASPEDKERAERLKNKE